MTERPPTTGDLTGSPWLPGMLADTTTLMLIAVDLAPSLTREAMGRLDAQIGRLSEASHLAVSAAITLRFELAQTRDLLGRACAEAREPKP